jgi:hypothetical protein
VRRTSALRVQQCDWINPHPPGDPLEALEREVALAALKPAHVGAVYLDEIRERLLAEPAGFSVGPQVAPNGALEITFHVSKASPPLLDSLQTDK